MAYGTRSGGDGFSLRRSLAQWAKGWLSGKPHFVIGGPNDPYVFRRYLIPRNPLCNVYLHKFLRDDDDRALHDHPWDFLSLILRGGYDEVLRDDSDLVFVRRGWLSLAFRPAVHRHRVRLFRDRTGRMVPCWTVIITGPQVRDWGFWCPQGWRHWKEFTAFNDGKGDYGQVGRGCD